MKILVMGATGMIGSSMLRVLTHHKTWDVYGTVRNTSANSYCLDEISKKIFKNVDCENTDIAQLFYKIKPSVVINCIGLTKHLPDADDPLRAIPMNSLWPHRLNMYCKEYNVRLIHISTDCVFSGTKGNYIENDPSDAKDMYGKSKFIGEVTGEQVVTLRTSTIGHELYTRNGLLEWFLSQEGKCRGYAKAIFSGLPATTLAEVIRDYVIPDKRLSGLYHVSGPVISKYDLLNIIAKAYNKVIDIEYDESFKIDRSLNSGKFNKLTGYIAPDWTNLVKSMHEYQRIRY